MTISLIVPCYNEETRLPAYLDNLVKYIKPDDECIFVDDGSRDNTVKVLNEFKKSHKGKVKIVKHETNQGKGAAIRTGLNHVSQPYTVFTDADGSVDMKYLSTMKSELKKHDMVIASKIAAQSEILVKQPKYRIFVGKTFNFLVNLFFNIGFYDTLCGFKGFNDKSRKIFIENMQSTRWVFDVEMLYLERKHGLDICEIPIVWSDRRGSKINILTPAKIFVELVQLRIRTLFTR